jgi:hypothetical protein
VVETRLSCVGVEIATIENGTHAIVTCCAPALPGRLSSGIPSRSSVSRRAPPRSFLVCAWEVHMKALTLSVMVVLLPAGGLLAQGLEEIRTVGADMLGALSGDMERFERGMRTLESLLATNPGDPRLKVLHGTGVFARAGAAFQKGDVPNAMKLWQSSLDEMAQAVEMAPNDVFVRARRGVVLVSASRAMPEAMAAPLTRLAVEDFGRVLEIREKEQTLAQRSVHQRGELLTGLADGWNRLGDPDKARGYFERITRDLKGTVYGQKAQAWLEDTPEARTAEYFTCSGCHVD